MLAVLMGVKSMSCHEVHAQRFDAGACVIDVNAPWRWSTGHVPGARNLDANGFTRHELPADTGALLVFYCSNPMCRNAPIAPRRAKAMGFGNVRVMSAGIHGWVAVGLSVKS